MHFSNPFWNIVVNMNHPLLTLPSTIPSPSIISCSHLSQSWLLMSLSIPRLIGWYKYVQPAGVWTTSTDLIWCMRYASKAIRSGWMLGLAALWAAFHCFKTISIYSCIFTSSIQAIPWHACFLADGYIENSCIAIRHVGLPLNIRNGGGNCGCENDMLCISCLCSLVDCLGASHIIYIVRVIWMELAFGPCSGHCLDFSLQVQLSSWWWGPWHLSPFPGNVCVQFVLLHGE